MNILSLLSEQPHEPNSSVFLSGFTKVKLVEKTTYPENMPQTFGQWVLEMNRKGLNFKWFDNKITIKETKTINLTSR